MENCISCNGEYFEQIQLEIKQTNQISQSIENQTFLFLNIKSSNQPHPKHYRLLLIIVKYSQQNMNHQLVQSYDEQSFPNFPVSFQNQHTKDQQKLSKITNSSDYGVFKKFPRKELNQLKENLKNLPKYDTKYSFLWTDQLSKLKVQEFLLKMYQPFDPQFINDFTKQLHGVKILRIGDHKVCVGKIKDNLCEGDYVIIFKNGTVYEGQMVQNKRHGKGVFYDPNLGIYKGFFKNDMKEGQGLEVLQNKIAFKGTFMNGLRHCTNGFYVDSNQNQYFGEWKLGIMHGKGFLKTKGSIYYGVFANWLKHGQGEQKFVEGDTYQGQYQNGRFDGFGTYKWGNGNAVYEGLFKNGFRHGKGKWSQNETKYLGNYSQGLKEGYGELYFPSGNFYKGNFVSDRRQGYGEIFWTDGSFYKGEWRNGTQNGKGQIYLNGGQIMSGIFQNSILVKVTNPPNGKQGVDGENDADFVDERGLMGQKNRTFSQNKGFNYNKRLQKIDENVRKPPNSLIKGNMYFRSPQKSDRSLSKRKLNFTQNFSHNHDGKQCKCVKRLQNFRLKMQTKSKVNDSRFNINA